MSEFASNLEQFEITREKIALKEKQIALMEGLPFLHGWKWYTWAHEFYDSINKLNFLCAANQISKSSTQIRKAINWATNIDLWPRLWPRRPVQFWYLYPSQKVVDAEFKTKWQQFLPRGEYKTHPVYGWKEIIMDKRVVGILFNTGVYLFFKTYTQDVQDLQTGTCDAIFCDEELPVELYSELIFRVSASDGYFHMVFTATLGQDFWREVIEERGTNRERLTEAAKWQVSMYDCQVYEDGTPSSWTDERIAIIKARCKSQNEILRRVYGRFVLDEGRKYEQFDMKKHMIDPKPVQGPWLFYVGVDTGSGGAENHPAAIAIVAVRPDFRYAEVISGWRGDNQNTTSSDIVSKFLEMKGDRHFAGQYYDWADKDFFLIATGMGEPFQPAEKSHEKGEDVINTLFKNDMLFIHDGPELQKLGWELSNVRVDQNKRKAKDDFCDALRYAVTRIPWDWSGITGKEAMWKPKVPEKKKTELERQNEERRSWAQDKRSDENALQEEFDEWNDLYG